MTRAQTETAADVVVDEGAAGNGRRYVFSGDWRHETAEAMAAKLKRLEKPAGGQSEFDFSG
ncbi:organic solvent ABC transporter permease, partial [Sinorhizobium meliloti]